VREDPARDELLYAGTEYGLFVSLNGGRTWQTLQRNLPVTPVADLRVQGSDLVVATQGRSLWILDDLTPLRQTGEVARNAPAHLFRPRDTPRVEIGGGGAGGVESAPDNLPAGALVHYYLGTKPDKEVTLEVLDAKGAVVRRFSSDSAKARVERTDTLATGVGMHRIVWDLTYPAPKLPKGSVIWGYTGGVKAPPGTYAVRLTANGVTQTKEFRILADPRLATQVTQADYEEQFRVAIAIRDSLEAVSRAVDAIRSIKEQAQHAVEAAEKVDRAGEVKPAADSLGGKLTGVETDITQTKSQSGQDPLRFPGRLDNQLAELYGAVTGTDGYISGGPEGRPAKGAYERMADVLKDWAPIAQRYQTILDRDVPAFNELLRRLGLGAIVVQRKTVS
jgi:hypothetical protein